MKRFLALALAMAMTLSMAMTISYATTETNIDDEYGIMPLLCDDDVDDSL